MIMTMLGVFLIHVLFGLPLFIALLTTALVGFMFVDPAMIPRMMPQQFFGGINAFSLMAIPLFILAGNLMNVSGLTERLMGLARLLVGHMRGGMGQLTPPPLAPSWCPLWKKRVIRAPLPRDSRPVAH